VYEDYIIWLPNAFTPNGDNLNELFELKYDATLMLNLYPIWREGDDEESEGDDDEESEEDEIEEPFQKYATD
jgi:hypothetical protein